MTTLLILQTTEKMDVIHQDRLFRSPVRTETVLLVAKLIPSFTKNGRYPNQPVKVLPARPAPERAGNYQWKTLGMDCGP